MSVDVGSLSPVPASTPLAWPEVWLKALTSPSVETYATLVRDPGATSSRAYLWIFLTSLVGFGLSSLVQWVFTSVFGSASPGAASSAALASPLALLVCGAPVAGVISVVSLMLSAGVSQLVAAALGGTGTYAKLAYALAAYLAPLTLISGVIGSIPLVNCLALPLGIYGLVLNIIAVKAVHQFSWGKAIAASVVVFAGILIVVALITIVILALLGPAIGNVFSNIVQDIATPIP
jgi:hypothetical protein